MKSRIVYIGEESDTFSIFNNKLNENYEILFFETGLEFLNWTSDKDHAVKAIVYADPRNAFSGIPLLKQLCSMEYMKSIPFILICGKLDFSDKRKLIQEGVSELMDLSFDKESIIKRLDYLIANPIVRKGIQNPVPVITAPPQYRMPFMKRAFDILFSSIVLLLLSPLFLIIGVLIKIESRGPVFYSSKRVGTGYRIFDFYKFRSMSMDADKRLKDISHLNQYKKEVPQQEVAQQSLCDECKRNNTSCQAILYLDRDAVCEKVYYANLDTKKAATFIKINNDPRVTRIGKFIRNTSIDELPQLVNVLKGDMSIVGNRPLPLYEAEKITTDKFVSRFLAPAGITGLWQVTKRGGSGKMSEEERMELDNDYARNYSFSRDLSIILKTIPALIQKENV